MQPESPLIKKFIDHLRIVSAALFAFAALCLLGVFMLEGAYKDNPDALLWLKVLEEIPKGVLAASAVAFLYDWLLKLENANQMSEAFGKAFDAVKLELLDGTVLALEARSDDAYVDYLKEAVLSPLEDETLPAVHRFYQVSVHCRFNARYFGDAVRFALLTSEGPVTEIRGDASCIFYWLINYWPRTPAQGGWLSVPSLKVNNRYWRAGEPVVSDNAIFIEFQKPEGVGSMHTHLVSYEFDVRLIDSTETISFYVARQTLRPVFRLDARRLDVKSISLETMPEIATASRSNYVAGPEGEGTCQVFFTGRVKPVATVSFTIKKAPR